MIAPVRRAPCHPVGVRVGLRHADCPRRRRSPRTRSKPREWKLSVAVGPAFALGKAAEAWAKRIAERSGGTMVVALHPGASLANRDPDREFGALRDGVAGAGRRLDARLVGAGRRARRRRPAVARSGPPGARAARDGRRARSAVRSDRARRALFRSRSRRSAIARLRPRNRCARPTTCADWACGSALPVILPTSTRASGRSPGRCRSPMLPRRSAPEFSTRRRDRLRRWSRRVSTTLGLRHVTLWGAVAELAVFAVGRADVGRLERRTARRGRRRRPRGGRRACRDRRSRRAGCARRAAGSRRRPASSDGERRCRVRRRGPSRLRQVE